MSLKSKVARQLANDPKSTVLRLIDNLIEQYYTIGDIKELKEHLKEKHGWLFK